jgi:purine nucleosidase
MKLQSPALAGLCAILLATVVAFHQAHAASVFSESPSSANTLPNSVAPINVIFDTDIWSDIDDMLALAMVHALHDRHELNLVAVTISTDDPWCASYVDLVDTFYQHSQIPVGIVHGGMNVEMFRKKYPNLTWPVTRYTQTISELKARDGSPLYPHHLIDGTKALEAISLLRKTLAAQPDASVVVIQVGYSTNLARLLDSGADASSPLDGRELVAKKIRLLSVMAGSFRDVQSENNTVRKGSPEFNVAVDVPAARKVFSSWPTPIVVSGFEIGMSMLYPGKSIEQDYSYAEHHPIADAYRTYCEEQVARRDLSKETRCPGEHDHATFDLTAVLYAARPDRNYFSLSKPGKITVLDDGGTRFEESEWGTQRHLILDVGQKARTLEAMVMLASQPPRAK